MLEGAVVGTRQVQGAAQTKRAGVEWHDLHGTERAGKRSEYMKEVVVGVLSISRRTSAVKRERDEFSYFWSIHRFRLYLRLLYP